MIKNKSFQKVLGNNKKRHLKIPDQFDELSYGDIATIMTCETDNYTEVIYRFKIKNLKNYENYEQIKAEQEKAEQERLELIKAEQIKAEQERLELIKAEQERLELIKTEQERLELIKAEKEKNEFECKVIKLSKNQNLKKILKLESQKRLITCEFCDKPLNKRMVIFINVMQNPIHYFCNKECKSQWIYQKQQDNN